MQTGPRTEKGRARSRLNAKRHGLAIPIDALPELKEEVRELTRALAGGLSDPGIEYVASMVATAEVELRRIQRVRTSWLNACIAVRETGGIMRYDEIFTMLLKLDRYERRAYAKKMRGLQLLR
jgi:hypothetical protein